MDKLCTSRHTHTIKGRVGTGGIVNGNDNHVLSSLLGQQQSRRVQGMQLSGSTRWNGHPDRIT